MTIKLTKIQEEIVQFGEGALLVLAGPGSGKTLVVTERIRRLLSESQGNFRILALTFTNKAANEMKERLIEFPDINKKAFIGTLHSFCMEVLANRGQSEGFYTLPNIFEFIEDRKKILFQAIGEIPELNSKFKKIESQKRRKKLLNDWLELIRNAKINLKTPEMIDDPIFKNLYESYNANLRASNAVDFDDLLFYTYQIFEKRPKIADFYRRQYRYICIDEAQDLNKAQYRLITALCGRNYRNVMMVGDPKQAIFTWCGASPKYLDLFKKDFDAKVREINENFRCSKSVIEAANALNPNYKTVGIFPIEGEIELIESKTEEQEAELVLKKIQNLIDKGHKDLEEPLTLNNFAVLGRTRYSLSEIQKELENKNLSYYIYLSSEHEAESDVIKDFELGLRLLVNSYDQLHGEILLKRWNFNMDFFTYCVKNNLDFFQELEKKEITKNQKIVLKALKVLKGTEENINFLNAIKIIETFASTLEEDDRELIIKDLDLWKQHWDYFLRSEYGGTHKLGSLLSQIALGCTQPSCLDGIALLTIHSAKGLEFDVVFIVGMTEGTFPDYRVNTPKEHEEEQRNAFVAITRAKRLVYFSYPKTKKMPWGDIKHQTPSRYLRKIGII